MNSEVVFLLLFIVATAVAIGARWVHLPYTVALVLAGLALGATHLFPAPQLTKDLLFSVFLPGLVFEAAFHIDFREFWRNRTTVVSLAVPGVLASIALTVVILTPVAPLLHLAHHFTWRDALVFGSLIAATDPIAVLAIFRDLGIPRRLAMVLGGESLLNDGTGIVFFSLSMSLIAGAAVPVTTLGLAFLKVVGMGVVIGATAGALASELIRRVDDPMIEITLTTMAAYGSFAAADQLGFSGVIATLTAGLMCGNYGARTGMAPSTRVATETFWEYVAFALNSIVFLLIGLEVRIQALLSLWPAILVAYMVVTLGRALVVLAAWVGLGFTRERFSGRWASVLAWGGMRGALPMVLALSLPANFQFRSFLITVTFGVVIISILVQGLTMSRLLRWLGIARTSGARNAYELHDARLLATDAALEEIERLARRRTTPPAVLDALREEYRAAAERARGELANLDTDRQQIREAELKRVRHQLLMVEKRALIDAHQQARIGDAAYESQAADVDARLLHLESDESTSERDADPRISA